MDCKEESLRRAAERIEKGKITNATIVQANLRFWNSPFDIGLGSEFGKKKLVSKKQWDKSFQQFY